MVIRTFEQLVMFFDAGQVPHNVDRARRWVELPGRQTGLPGHLVIKWETSAPFLQMTQMVLEAVPPDRLRELATAIVVLNHRLEMGGFGFDIASSSLYFRLYVSVFPSEGINPTILAPLRHGVVRNALEFQAAFTDVIAGAPGDEVVERYEASLLVRESSGADA